MTKNKGRKVMCVVFEAFCDEKSSLLLLLKWDRVLCLRPCSAAQERCNWWRL